MNTRLVLYFGVACLLAGAPAAARTIVIDNAEFLPSLSPVTPCTIGGGTCSPVTLPFTLNLSSGATSDAYIYDRGIISFGTPLPAIGPTDDITTLGVPLIAPLYVPGASGVAGPYSEVNAGAAAPSDFNLNLDFATSGSDLFVVTFLDPALDDEGNFLQGLVTVVIDASSDQLSFQFLYGMSNLIDGNRVTVLPNTDGTQLGYAIDGQSRLDAPPNIAGTNAFSVALGAPAVPEPATWVAMLLGFAAIGLSFRGSRKSLSPVLTTAS
jgi:PEP-CTERM motif-containing protein